MFLLDLQQYQLLEFPKTDFNALYANIFVQDSVTKEINYNEVIVDFDGTDTTIAQIYVDTEIIKLSQ